MEGKRLDLTCGNPISGILRFSGPLVLGNLFQQLYSIVDAIIIGQCCGVDALSAVSCTSWICWMVNALCRDSGNAFGILGSLRAGQHDQKIFRQIVSNTLLYGLFVAASVTSLCLLSLNGIVTGLNIPGNIQDGARIYLTINLLGIPAMLAFNLASALLRAIGNSSVTMTAMTASTVLNIVLDVLFVIGFGWEITGAALATLLSIMLSAGIAWNACRKSEWFHIGRGMLRPDWGVLREAMSLLFPMLLNSAIIAVGGMVVLSRCNLLGSAFVAGRSAEGKIFGLLEAVIMALQTGVSVFVGQNLGTGRISRITRGLHQSLIAIMGIFLVMAMGVLAFLDPILNLFLSKQDPASYAEAFHVAQEATRCILAGMLVMTPMYIYRITIQTLGHAIFSTIAGIGQIILRILTISVGPSLIGIYAYYITDCMAWAISLPIVLIPCYYHLAKLKKKVQHEQIEIDDSTADF